MCMQVHMHMHGMYVEISALPFYHVDLRDLGWNSDCEAWQQVPFLNEHLDKLNLNYSIMFLQ